MTLLSLFIYLLVCSFVCVQDN